MGILKREVSEEAFFDQVEVDGAAFRQVIFDGTELVYRGGAAASLDRCRLLDMTFTFNDAAGETFGFMRALAGINPDLHQVRRDLVPELQG